MISGHGDDQYQFDVAIRYNFSSNVFYKGTSNELIQLLQKELELALIESYPSPAANELSQLAPLVFGLTPDHYLFTNGATEAFYLIAHTFQATSAVLFGPTFSEYQDACSLYNIDVQWKNRTELSSHQFTENIAFICNPNNPDGSILQQEEIELLIRNYPATTFIIDEAYIEFCPKATSVLNLIKHYSNLIVVKSLTKTFSIPGLRLGYIVAPPSMIELITSHKMPWSVNSLAIKAGEFILKNYSRLTFDSQELITQMDAFTSELNQLDFLSVLPSETTYCLVELKKGTASALKKYLVDHHQILIRDASNFVGIKGEFIRLSLQNTTANTALLNALKQWN